MLHTGAYSDIKITCQGSEFNVHRTVLIASGGDFFRAAILGPWKEAATSVIDLPENEPSIIARVLFFIYTGEYLNELVSTKPSQLHSVLDLYKQNSEDNAKLRDEWNLHTEMFAMATKFGIPDLRLKAKIHFTKAISTAYNESAGERTFASLPGVVETVKKVYESPVESFRELQVIIASHFAVEVDWAHSNNEGFPDENLFKEVPGLVLDLFMGYAVDLTAGWFCPDEKTARRLWLPSCKCRKIRTLCEEEECIQAYAEHKFCRSCLIHKGKVVLKVKRL